MGWKWHRLDHMQITCTSLQTYNHVSTSSLNLLQTGCSSWRPTNSVEALKAQRWLEIGEKYVEPTTLRLLLLTYCFHFTLSVCFFQFHSFAFSGKRNVFLLWSWTFACDLDIRTWSSQVQGQPPRQISRSKVISFDINSANTHKQTHTHTHMHTHTQTHAHSWPTAAPGPQAVHVSERLSKRECGIINLCLVAPF